MSIIDTIKCACGIHDMQFVKYSYTFNPDYDCDFELGAIIKEMKCTSCDHAKDEWNFRYDLITCYPQDMPENSEEAIKILKDYCDDENEKWKSFWK